MEDSSKFLRDVDGYLLKALEADAHDIREIERKADVYRESIEVCSRELIIQYLKKTCEKKGQFVCLLGGKSFGKSKCLSYLANEANRGMSSFPEAGGQKEAIEKKANDKEMLVLLVDMRSQGGKSILLGMIEALDEAADKDVDRKVVKGMFNVWARFIPLDWIKTFVVGSFVDVYTKVRKNLTTDDKIKLCENLIQELSKTRKVTVIVDEANLAFDRDLLDQEQLKQAQADLALLTRLTKQETKVFLFILFDSLHC
jgi:hypothetical protein